MASFSWELILGCVRRYCKYGISYRELEEMMLERGMEVDHTTIYRWVQHCAGSGKAFMVVLEASPWVIAGRSIKPMCRHYCHRNLHFSDHPTRFPVGQGIEAITDFCCVPLRRHERNTETTITQGVPGHFHIFIAFAPSLLQDNHTMVAFLTIFPQFNTNKR